VCPTAAALTLLRNSGIARRGDEEEEEDGDGDDGDGDGGGDGAEEEERMVMQENKKLMQGK
jgi:hypothetical protein